MNEKALFAISCGLYVIGAKAEDGFAGSIVDALIQATAVPPTFILCSQRQTHTCECIRKTGAFSVSVLRKDVDPRTIALFGFQSSRVARKWPAVSHRLQQEIPVLTEVAAWMICRVKHSYDMKTHVMFHCDVVEAEEGQGEPLTYAYYREALRHATTAAFQAYKREQTRN